MADMIGFTKDQLHKIYDQVTSQPESGTRNDENGAGPGLAGGSADTTTSSSAPASHTAVPTTGSGTGSGKDTVSNSALGTRNEVSTTASDAASREKPTTEASAAHHSNIVAAAALASHHDDSRRDSDIGPRNEATPEHHHHHQDKIDHEDHKDGKATATATAVDSNANGLNYGNVSHLGASSTTPSGPRRQSLADSPYRGNIHTTVSPSDPSKKWSFSMGDFGLKLPRQASNATAQELNKDGSVSMQGGQGRVARGIGSISSTVKRGSVDQTVTPKDPTKRWSFNHGDFGLKLPKQQSNAVAQELNRDGSVSSQGGLGPPSEGVSTSEPGAGGTAAGAAAPLGRQNARGIGSISSAVRRGSVDVSVSEHDKARKWSLKDADFGLKWPKQASNLQHSTS